MEWLIWSTGGLVLVWCWLALVWCGSGAGSGSGLALVWCWPGCGLTRPGQTTEQSSPDQIRSDQTRPGGTTHQTRPQTADQTRPDHRADQTRLVHLRARHCHAGQAVGPIFWRRSGFLCASIISRTEQNEHGHNYVRYLLGQDQTRGGDQALLP